MVLSVIEPVIENVANVAGVPDLRMVMVPREEDVVLSSHVATKSETSGLPEADEDADTAIAVTELRVALFRRRSPAPGSAIDVDESNDHFTAIACAAESDAVADVAAFVADVPAFVSDVAAALALFAALVADVAAFVAEVDASLAFVVAVLAEVDADDAEVDAAEAELAAFVADVLALLACVPAVVALLAAFVADVEALLA